MHSKPEDMESKVAEDDLRGVENGLRGVENVRGRDGTSGRERGPGLHVDVVLNPFFELKWWVIIHVSLKWLNEACL